MLIMTSIIRVGQSKYTTVPIDEDSQERIMNCVSTLADLDIKDITSAKQTVVSDMFLKDTKAAYAKMVATEEVCAGTIYTCRPSDDIRDSAKLQKKERRRIRALRFKSMTS